MQYLSGLLIALGIMLTGCSSTSGFMAPETAQASPLNEDLRSVVKKASLSIEVDDVAAIQANITNDVKNLKGFIDNIYANGDKRLSFNIRIPVKDIESFLDAVATYGKVISKTYSEDDVTNEMLDIDARLKNLYVLRDRFRELLNKANEVSEVLAIEKELARVQSDIDSIEARQTNLKSQVDYSNIRITINQKTIYGPLGYVGYGLYWVIEKLFIIR